MSEILLQTIVEKLESLEIALLKESNTGKEDVLQKQTHHSFKSLQAEIQMFVSQLNNHNEKLNGFSKEMNLLRLNLVNLEPGHVKHIHHFHKLVWVTLSLFIIALLLAYGWINCYRWR